MTPIVAVLGIAVCVALGVIVRCHRDAVVLRHLERLMDGCDPHQRVEVCRILAASLQEARSPEPTGSDSETSANTD